MADDVKVEVRGTLAGNIDRLATSLASARLVIEGEKLLKDTKRTLRELSPKGSATGELYKSLSVSKATPNAQNVLIVRVGSALPYAAVVERGRQPNQAPPPVEVIKKWLLLKSLPIPQGMTLDSYAFVIARKIGKKGTLALAFLDKAAKNYRGGVIK